MNSGFTAVWSAGGVLCGGVAVTLMTLVLVRLRRYRGVSAAGGSRDFSMARYEPMARLLSSDDLAFLQTQPGYRAEIGAKLQKDRRRIFRMYLKDLAADFQELHGEARKMAAVSPEQHSHLIGALMRQQLHFWRAMMLIEIRLMLPSAGVATAEIRGLIAVVEEMRLQLSSVPAV